MDPSIGILLLFILIFSLLGRGSYKLYRSAHLGKYKSKFSCTQCGKCCFLKVEPTEADIERIEKTGHKRENFMEGPYLKKQEDGGCVFLKKKKDLFFCKIYENRPDICRKYPFKNPRGLVLADLRCPEVLSLDKK